ncbi:MAG: CueP family metal-binding protein [Desulfobacterales bacterium]|nr:MAG: CueP family metal-binding protein [Desulfobacterales bacterium]
MSQIKLNVKAVDEAGNVLIDRPVATLKNGFMELWFPRHRTINLTLEGRNRSASAVISTFDGSDTCITTMQLK